MMSLNKVENNIEQLALLFPNVMTEAFDSEGRIKRAIDFDLLKQELSDFLVEGEKERYQLTWPGKREAILNANSSSDKTLRPVKDDSVDWESTQNIYIEGDNSNVLKLLQESYLNKVKCIYIDPPYNTGKDFIYRDDFKSSSITYLTNSGQVDDEGNRMVQNTETNGRYHSDWLTMMYSRLKVSKNLLREDGLIFISIDESEHPRLRLVCDEIFGVHNHIADLVWQNKKGGGNDSKHIAVEHEYILVYSKNKELVDEFYEVYSEDYLKRYKEEDSHGKYYWDTFKRKSGKQYYPITCPDGFVLEFDNNGNPISWLRSEKRFLEDLKQEEARIIKVGDNWSVQFKQRLPKGKTPRSIYKTNGLIEDYGTTSDGSTDLLALFGKDVFSNPKPVSLLRHLLGFGLGSEDVVLDFFSGSGTMAQAVMELNAEDKGNRKYILVQLPEDINTMYNTAEQNRKMIFKNALDIIHELNCPPYLTELGKERIRRAAKKIKQETGVDIDYGFRVYRVDSSNMKDVYYTPDKLGQLNLDDVSSNIKEDRTAEDLLIQVMLECGLELSLPMESREIEGKAVHYVAGNSLIACFDENVTDSVIRNIAADQPLRVIFRDSSFRDDSARINVEELFKLLSPSTEIQVL
ncbi:site-specific DNA-methyltransferase [Paenibacillus sp. NEAU-GSW1]|uniref:site-specific DNA-methyltransferase n=1 Tax=Paenibacillus sp. NEAU-GSW1 TaxID=2682486 RepID=UPI0020A64C16|nr:site-specific DNA-methyltransferase [Paenibacillus sp. NEAU-GSW1]